LPDLDLHLGRAGIQAVLDQLFGDICRAFHHFTGSDLGGYVLGKKLNGHSSLSIPFMRAIVPVRGFPMVPASC